MTGRRALVTGATGAVGRVLVDALQAEGWQVRLLARDPARCAQLFPAAEVIGGDLDDIGATERAVTGQEVVFHLAALLHVANAGPDLRDQYFRINADGAARVAEQAARAGVTRVVLFSTINVYGSTGGEVVDEYTAPAPDTDYGRSKLEAERRVLGVRSATGEPIGVVLRMAAVYGASVRGNYRRLLDAIARGRFLPIGSGHNRRTLVYDRDAATAALLAVNAAGGSIYNVTDGRFHSVAEIVAAISAALGRRPPRFAIPEKPARLAAYLAGRVLGRRSPLTPSSLDKYLEDVAIRGDRIQKELGFVPRYDLQSGWNETVERLRQSGNLL